mgnify:CR=1 FL=1|tara:strand:- start:82 stop:297 length:216 start_codon:yes stop_codon:yes gene_type:complete
MAQWNVRTIASVQYYEDQIVEADTRTQAENKVREQFDEHPNILTWNEYHEGDNMELRIDQDSTEKMESNYA